MIKTVRFQVPFLQILVVCGLQSIEYMVRYCIRLLHKTYIRQEKSVFLTASDILSLHYAELQNIT